MTDDDAYKDTATQTAGDKADNDGAATYINARMQTMDDNTDNTAVKWTTGNDAG
jgi:hypothetical protein